MQKITESRLLRGIIYGDSRTKEYVYLPGSEISSTPPVLVYEHDNSHDDVEMEEALTIIEKRNLQPLKHPLLGEKTI